MWFFLIADKRGEFCFGIWNIARCFVFQVTVIPISELCIQCVFSGLEVCRSGRHCSMLNHMVPMEILSNHSEVPLSMFSFLLFV
ncbi:hypothetical protein AQUCO_05000020v1 [Aquilegia coerulea]|uniref:Uncharacterized protein n=1 Tax=Aquilegia coerulea TaxID=218851 RepID=A0A2G5CJ69_AQUCA|nr:hypothetical protein AQUCO_05000020v1 [Aquilegia coerulea]